MLSPSSRKSRFNGHSVKMTVDNTALSGQKPLSACANHDIVLDNTAGFVFVYYRFSSLPFSN